MQAETIRQALAKLDELDALTDEIPDSFVRLYYDYWLPVKRIRKALEEELYYVELDLCDGLVEVRL